MDFLGKQGIASGVIHFKTACKIIAGLSNLLQILSIEMNERSAIK